MKRLTFALKTALVLAPVLGLALVAQKASAGSLLYDPGPDTCTGLNCNSSAIFGTYQRDQVNNAEPFTVQIFSSGNECVRINGLAQAVDLEAVLVAPNGQIWRDDDGGGSLRPLIKANTPSGVRGWYTLQISGFSGTQARSDFQLAYGRYNLGNPNCSGAVVPLSVDAVEAPKPSGNSAPLPPAGTNR